MLDLPDSPLLDKKTLVGGCIRLPLRVDAERLRQEVGALPDAAWGSAGGRVGVHNASESVFLRGHAPAELVGPLEDRPVFDLLPYARTIVEQMIPAPPLRCLLARLPPGAVIRPHIDRELYFWKSLRVHIAVDSHERAWMYCDGLSYLMRPGEVWLLNNTAVHAVWNEHATLARTHLICDYLASPELLALLKGAERNLGLDMPRVVAHLTALAPQASAAPA